MATTLDHLLARRLIDLGIVDAAAVLEAIDELDRRLASGSSRELGQILLHRRHLTTKQYLVARREAEASIFHCPDCRKAFKIQRYEIGGDHRCRHCDRTLDVIVHRADSDPVARPQLGPYTLERKIGEGGMGVVFKATHQRTGQVVALKVLRGGGDDPDHLERFLREAHAIGQLVDPGIVRLLEGGNTDGRSWCAMEWVEGRSLAERLGGEPLPVDEALSTIERIARSVAVAHAAGIVHRDLKPSNIMIRPDGRPVVLDFGLARFLGPDVEALTATGAILGTPHYMAPEQAVGAREHIDARTDVYALGVLLYLALTGRTPFLGNDLLALLARIRSGEPPPPSSLAPEIPPAVERVCLRALARLPGDRYPDASALADAIAGVRTP